MDLNMIYAIATSEKKLSHKFSQTELFTFYNEENKEIAVYKNPALEGKSCSSKKLIIELFNKMHCDCVIVRKIGEKTLARLLNAGIQVEQGNTRHTTQELLENARLHKCSLTNPKQGVKGTGSSCGSH